MPSDRSLVEREIERVELRPFTLDGFHQRRQRKERNRRIGTAVVALLVAGVAIGAMLRAFSSSSVPADDPRAPFLGAWVVGSDADGSRATMTVEASGDGAIQIELHDDFASACSGARSTMTGTGDIRTATDLVIPSPDLTCDDGSEPAGVHNPTDEDLRDFTFVYQPAVNGLLDPSSSAAPPLRASSPSRCSPASSAPVLPPLANVSSHRMLRVALTRCAGDCGNW
jgi:hypothetical protein